MGMSETIIAAMIGAIATVSAAWFQLITAFRAKGTVKSDANPKRGLGFRSILAVLALMVACSAGGFLYSELVKQRAGEDLRAMRQELKELRRELSVAASGTLEVAPPKEEPVPQDTAADPQWLPASVPASVAASAESIVYVPACRKQNGAAACEEAEAQRVALCGTVPGYASVERIELFAQPDAIQKPWVEHRVEVEQDLGSARFTGKSFEYAQAGDLKAVCVNFMQWSSEHPYLARVLIHYGVAEPTLIQPEPAIVIPSDPAAETVVSTDAALVPQAAAMTPAP